MKTKTNYVVKPEHESKITDVKNYPLPSGYKYNLAAYVNIFAMIGAFIFFLIGIFSGNWIIFILCILAIVICEPYTNSRIKKSNIQYRTMIAKKQAIEVSAQLNDLLSKSYEILDIILPNIKLSIQSALMKAKNDFKENALYPFWEDIEEVIVHMGLFKDSVDQLSYNGELYTKILKSRSHNFPVPFPIPASVAISQELLDEFNYLVREAHKKQDFANIFGHIKTQKVIIVGFKTLAEAINNMTDSIVSAIYDLKDSIKLDFKESHKINIEQINSFQNSQSLLNQTLKEMDNKLYYMQYREKPNAPFNRPLFDI